MLLLVLCGLVCSWPSVDLILLMLLLVCWREVSHLLISVLLISLPVCWRIAGHLLISTCYWLCSCVVVCIGPSLSADVVGCVICVLECSWPSVKGIMLWAFWDGAIWRPDAALLNGPDFEVGMQGMHTYCWNIMKF